MARDQLIPAPRHEDELLVLCARLTIGDADRERIIDLLKLGLDWDRLIRSAMRNHLQLLLYRNLNDLGPSSVPRPAFARLWRTYEATRRRNRVMADELVRILRLLRDRSIEAVPYKGPVLAFRVYGDISLRQFVDLDILVKTKDVLQALQLLQTDGYGMSTPLTHEQESALIGSSIYQHMELTRPEKNILVELHWKMGAMYQSFPATNEEWWAKRKSLDFEGTAVPWFAPEELLTILCVHGAKERWSALGWLVDVAEVVRQQPLINWDQLVAEAGKTGGKKRLALGLYLAHRVLGAPLPEAALRWVETFSDIPSIASEIVKRFFDETAPDPTALEKLRFGLRLTERRRDRVRYVFHVLMAPGIEEWTRCPLPRWLSFLHYLFRPIRLAVKHGTAALGRSGPGEDSRGSGVKKQSPTPKCVGS